MVFSLLASQGDAEIPLLGIRIMTCFPLMQVRDKSELAMGQSLDSGPGILSPRLWSFPHSVYGGGRCGLEMGMGEGGFAVSCSPSAEGFGGSPTKQPGCQWR